MGEDQSTPHSLEEAMKSVHATSMGAMVWRSTETTSTCPPSSIHTSWDATERDHHQRCTPNAQPTQDCATPSTRVPSRLLSHGELPELWPSPPPSEETDRKKENRQLRDSLCALVYITM